MSAILFDLGNTLVDRDAAFRAWAVAFVQMMRWWQLREAKACFSQLVEQGEVMQW